MPQADRRFAWLSYMQQAFGHGNRALRRAHPACGRRAMTSRRPMAEHRWHDWIGGAPDSRFDAMRLVLLLDPTRSRYGNWQDEHRAPSGTGNRGLGRA